MPRAAIVWMLAERYGYTVEYIENLSLRRLAEEAAVQDALARYQENQRKMAEKKARRRR